MLKLTRIRKVSRRCACDNDEPIALAPQMFSCTHHTDMDRSKWPVLMQHHFRWLHLHWLRSHLHGSRSIWHVTSCDWCVHFCCRRTYCIGHIWIAFLCLWWLRRLSPLPLLLLKLDVAATIAAAAAVLALALAVKHSSMLSLFSIVRPSISHYSYYCYYLYCTIVFRFDYCLLDSWADANHHHLHGVHLASLVLRCSKPSRYVHLKIHKTKKKEIKTKINWKIKVLSGVNLHFA